MTSRLGSTPVRLAALVLVALVLVMGLAGCRLVGAATETPTKLASALTPSKGDPKPDLKALSTELMRFGDLFAIEIRRATEGFAQAGDSPEALIQALEWRIRYSSEAWKRATFDQPFGGLLDLIMLSVALRVTHENHWSGVWGEANRPMVKTLTDLEGVIWKLAGEYLPPEQAKEAHALVEGWLASVPAGQPLNITSLPSLQELSGGSGGSSLFGGLGELVSLDMLAGLEPATREIEQVRVLGERFLYYGQRLPELLESRVELLVLRTLQFDETRNTLASWERISTAAESFAATGQALPAQLSAEREAAIVQISGELERQRAGLVSDMQTAQEPLNALLVETRSTAEATGAMSDSVAEALRTLGTFLDRFEPEDGPPPAEPKEPGKPFDVNEYGLAAERIGVAVRDLNATLITLDQSLPAIQRVLDEAADRGEETVDHAFVRGLQLLGVALAAGLVLVVVRRRRA